MRLLFEHWRGSVKFYSLVPMPAGWAAVGFVAVEGFCPVCKQQDDRTRAAVNDYGKLAFAGHSLSAGIFQPGDIGIDGLLSHDLISLHAC